MTKRYFFHDEKAPPQYFMQVFLLPVANRAQQASVSEEDAAIKERLQAKYVDSGEWFAMNPDEKEEDALLETKLYDREKGIELLTESEQTAFLNELRGIRA